MSTDFKSIPLIGKINKPSTPVFFLITPRKPNWPIPVYMDWLCNVLYFLLLTQSLRPAFFPMLVTFELYADMNKIAKNTPRVFAACCHERFLLCLHFRNHGSQLLFNEQKKWNQMCSCRVNFEKFKQNNFRDFVG